MTTGLLWFFLILLSSPWYANGRGIWSQLPRKRSSTTKSSPPTTSTFASSPSLPNDENQEIIRQLLQELFIVAEEFLTNTEFDSEEMFSMMQNLQWSFDEMRDLHSDGESDDQTENNPFLDENIDALRELFASLNTTNLRSKGLEFIAKGRESIDDIIDFLANPKKLIEYLQSLLSPEVFQQFQVLIPKTLPELKNFVNENFEIPADEFDEIIQPFQELIHEFSEILQNDGSFGNFDSPNAAAAGFNIIDEILDKEINFPNSPNDLGEDSIDDLLKIFHDPQKVGFPFL